MARHTVTRTVRLGPEIDQGLQKLAKRDRVSVNYLVNSSLKRLIDWDSSAEKFGFVAVPAFLHARMYSYFSEKQARELGEWAGKNFGRDFVLFWFKKISLDTVLDSLKLLSSRYARIFSMEHTFDGRVHTVVVKHGLGGKGSIFNEEFLTSMFKGLLNLNAESEHTEDQVVVRLKPVREIGRPSWPGTYSPTLEKMPQEVSSQVLGKSWSSP